jgi:spermidine synthase
MYETAARRLTPGGIFCQWLPLYQLTREEFNIIVRTFLAVFPQAGLWRNDFYSDLPVIGLVGQLMPKRLDLGRIRERVAGLPDWGKDPLFAAPEGLLMLYAGNLRAVSDLFVSAPLNTDDHPVIEFLAPRLTRVAATFSNPDWFTREALASFYDLLEARLAGIPDPLLPASQEIIDARRAGTALYHYAVAAARHDETAAARYQNAVRQLVPETVLTAGMAKPREKVEMSQQELSGLLKQQEALRQQLEDMQRRLGRLLASGENAQNSKP